MIGIVAVTITIVVIDSAVTLYSVVGLIHTLYSASKDGHGDFLIRYTIHIVALSTDLLLIGF